MELTLTLGILVAYLIGTLVIGLLAFRKTKTYDDFLVGRRSMGFLLIALTFFATALGGGYMIGTAENAFRGGLLFGIAYPLAEIAIFAIEALVIAKPWRELGAKHNLYTVPHALEYWYDVRARSMGAIFTAAGFIVVTAAQLLAGGAIISALTGISVTWAIVITCGIVIIYTSLSGFIGITWTDAMQSIVIVVGVLTAFVIAITKVGGFQGMMASPQIPLYYWSFTKTGAVLVITTFVSGTVNVFSDQIEVQRMMASKSGKTAQLAIIFKAIFAPLFGFMCVIIALVGMAMFPQIIEASQILPYTIANLFPGVFGAIFLAALLAGLMSTSDSCLLASTAPLVEDVYHRFIRPKASKSELLKASRYITLVAGTFSLFIALKLPTIIEGILISYAIKGSAMFIPVIGGFFFRDKLTKDGVFAGMLAGGSIACIWAIIGEPYGLNPVFIGAPLATIVTFGWSYTQKRLQRKK